MFGKIFTAVLTLIFAAGYFAPAYAYNENAVCSARAAIVTEASTGAVLYEKNASEKLGMASTTKIMTAICAIEHSDLSKIVEISPYAASVEGSSMYLETSEKIALGELVKGLLLVSGNDAAYAIAEGVSGSVGGFVLLMNKKADEIGAADTCFQNPHGLAESGHFTTAFDLAKITAYAMRNPAFAEIVSLKSGTAVSASGKKHFLTNHNRLLSLCEGCVGVKTGFTRATGRCLVTAAERDGMRLVCVTLNDGDDWRDHMSLYDRAFSEYTSVSFMSKGDSAGKISVEGGKKSRAELAAAYDITVPVKKEAGNDLPKSKQSISLKRDANAVLSAPIEAGVSTVEADIFLNGQKIGECTLTASESIGVKPPKAKQKKPSGFLRRLLRCFVK